LRALLKNYESVIFIAHSQGGLLAKTYASLYYPRQGILVTTLHTPHGNRAFSVMRESIHGLWTSHASYLVPHLFCGSVNDDRIVKVLNATSTGIDDQYVSSDRSKARYGHSHLSASPDDDLLALMREKTEHFINSGLSRDILSVSLFSKTESEDERPIRFVLSRSKKRLSEHQAEHPERRIIESPWTDDFGAFARTGENVKPLSMSIHGCSANYLVRCVFNNTSRPHKDLELLHLDNNLDSHAEVNDALCEKLFEAGGDILNPYRDLPFDINDISEKRVLDDKEFVEIFSQILIKKHFTLKQYISLPPVVYREKLREFYLLAIKQYKTQFVQHIYDGFPTRLKIGPIRFGEILTEIVVDRDGCKDFRYDHSKVYDTINRIGHKSKCKFGILGIEYVIASIFRTDGDFYWVDGKIKQIML
jgi:hypothetical protein